MKYVINKCFGGFGLSEKALRRLYELGCKEIATPVAEYYGKGWEKDVAIALERNANKELSIFKTVLADDNTVVLSESFSTYASDPLKGRAHPLLVQVVEELGEESWGWASHLTVVDVPEGIDVEITEYDGQESIRERSTYFG